MSSIPHPPKPRTTYPVVVAPHIRSDGAFLELAVFDDHTLIVPHASLDKLDIAVKHKFQTEYGNANSPEEKLKLLEALVLEHRLNHDLLTFPGGVQLRRKLWDLPTDIPREFFTPGVCGLTGFQTYANQLRPNPKLLNPQVLILIDGAGFGEVNAAEIKVPEKYLGQGYKNEANFVDLFIQITAKAIQTTVENYLSENRITSPWNDVCTCFRGGDEFSISIDKTKVPDAKKLASQIIESINLERNKLFDSLEPEDRNKLANAGAAIQKRAILGRVFNGLIVTTQLGAKSEPHQLNPTSASNYLAEFIRGQLTKFEEINLESGDKERHLEILQHLENTLSILTTFESDPSSVAKHLAELFVIATDFAEDPMIEAMPNQALGLNYTILDLPKLKSTSSLGAALHYGESIIEEQKISRTVNPHPIRVPKGSKCPRSMSALIKRLTIESETLAQIKIGFDALSDPKSPIEVLGLYEGLMNVACGDGAVSGAVRTSVARHLNLQTLWGIDSETTLYPVIITLLGMRPINSILGMNQADEIVAEMTRTISPYCSPLGVLKHMGDTAILLCAERPTIDGIDLGAALAQEKVNYVLEPLAGLSVFSAFKLAGKEIAAQFLPKMRSDSFPPPGLIQYSLGRALTVSSETSVGDLLELVL